MRLVVLESPYAGDVERNVQYARACIADCLQRGESPIASHLLFTQPGILDDGNEDQRGLGLRAGHAWIAKCDAVVVYINRGISRGMDLGIKIAHKQDRPVEYRCLPDPEWSTGCDGKIHYERGKK